MLQHTSRRAGLIHASLLRIVFLPDAERNATAAKAQRIVDRWSARMRGMRLTLKGLVYVKERQIMSLDGEWHRLRFGGAEVEQEARQADDAAVSAVEGGGCV